MADDTAAATRAATDIKNRARANEQAKRENETWFSKFVADIPQLDSQLGNYPEWIYPPINDVAHIVAKRLSSFP